jgi:hypothetical protein
MKIVTCDICGKDITDVSTKYKFKKYHSCYSNMEEFEFTKWTRLDMCESCFKKLCVFVNEQRGANNG